MDTWLFIEVQTYQSVNKMGLELGKYVEKRYDQAVVHKDCIYDISADIKQKMEELQEKYPRCRPFKFEKGVYVDRYQEKIIDLSAKPDNPYNDNYVFILRTKFVRKMNLEINLHI